MTRIVQIRERLRNGTTLHGPLADRQAETLDRAADFQQRLRWARRRGHPLYLWPEVAPDRWRAALRAIGRVTMALLAGETTRLRARVDGDLAALGVASFTSGMGPLLGWWIERGQLDADDGARGLLALHLEHGRRRARRMNAALCSTIGVLHAAGVPVTLLKGAHTARACFPEPGVRPMSDLDLLVAPGDVERAESALRDARYELVPGSRLTRPYRSDWRPPGASAALHSCMLHHEENPFTVDLHTSLDLDFFGVRTVRFPEPAGAARVPAEWAGPRATALAQPLLAAHLAAHASLGLYNLTLIRLTELALLLGDDTAQPLDWGALAELLRRARAERFVYPAMALVERLAPGTVPAHLRSLLERAATPALRRVIGAIEPATAQRLDGLALHDRFMWGTTPLDHLRRTAHMLLPGGARASLPRLRRIYGDRVLGLLRGRFTLRG